MAEATVVRTEATAVRGDGARLRRTTTLATVAALAAAVTVGCSASSAAGPAAHDGRHGAVTRTVPVAAIAPSVPDRIAVPGIEVDAAVASVGLDGKGEMETPPMDRPMEASWYRQGPTPGERGAAVIVGHMDTPETEKAVFHDLKDLRKRDEIKVHRRDGATAVFAVDSVETFKKDSFPTDKVYNRTDKAELHLITCGGSLTPNRHWDSNVVVFAHLTGEVKA
ncbi:class F sortase [Streptomyces sp. NPDC058657]|uniref:class F sortase n=1 Tax=unclassified Streptomyces TaxID=2593676 RepID=UPI0036501A38